jgi:hypothetical protein
METKEYTTIDKSTWDRGDWDGEPDKVQWQDEATGLPCLAVRHGHYGHWCGYVGVADGHPAYEKHYDSVDLSRGVHGGLTFSEACQPNDSEDRGICHIPADSEPDHVWWLGFDCAHYGDLSPSGRDYHRDGSYRTLKYVKSECRSLAAQLSI